jgi:hypothetical protein
MGRSDCNSGTAPDLDGCECATPGCCAGPPAGCQTTHSNGEGQSFYDCNALNTVNVNQALAACAAYAAAQGHPSTWCASNYSCGAIGGALFACYNTGGPGVTTCSTAPVCWGYQGAVTMPQPWVLNCASCSSKIGTWN